MKEFEVWILREHDPFVRSNHDHVEGASKFKKLQVKQHVIPNLLHDIWFVLAITCDSTTP